MVDSGNLVGLSEEARVVLIRAISFRDCRRLVPQLDRIATEAEVVVHSAAILARPSVEVRRIGEVTGLDLRRHFGRLRCGLDETNVVAPAILETIGWNSRPDGRAAETVVRVFPALAANRHSGDQQSCGHGESDGSECKLD
jgi:hypothetical protein